jgi:hypothetical protein
VSKPHRGQGGRTAKYPILVCGIYGDEAGFAELTPQQQEWMMKALWIFAEAVVAQERQDPRDRRHVANGDGHLGPHDAAGAQTITDGPFVRIKGDDADAPQPGFAPRSRPAIAVIVSRLPNTCE